MRKIASLAATAILICAPFGFALAQNAPDPGAPAAPAAQTPPANAPAPADQSANPPLATNAPTANAPATTTDNMPKTKKKKTAHATRRGEIERSIESGTVPSRYRSSVPREYQQYIPFSKN